MSSCKHVQTLLHTKEPGERTLEEQALVDEHLPECPSCAEHQRWMALTSSVVQRWDVPEVSSDFSMRVLAATEAVEQEQPWWTPWTHRWFRGRLIATMALSAVLLIAGWSLPTQKPPSRKWVKKSFSLIHGSPVKVDDVSIASRLLGIEVK